MNPVRIHDIATAAFLVPYSVLSVGELVFGYVIYPMFLTHALAVHMVYDLLWITIQPKVIPSLRKLIVLHHIVVLIFLLRPFMHPEESNFTARLSLVELDTSILILRRLVPKHSVYYTSLDKLYLVSNLMIRVYYETAMSVLLWFMYKNHPLIDKVHVLGCQFFVNIFSCGICALTFSKRNPALKEE